MHPKVAEILARGTANPPPPTVMPVKSGMDLIAQRVLAQNPREQSEIQRIVSLPINYPLTKEELAAVNEMHVKPDAPGGFALKDRQAEAIHEFATNQGLFAQLEVGGGKTLICLRCVGIAVERGVERICLFVPSQVYAQLVHHDIGWARQRIRLGCSFYLMGGKSLEQRRQLAGARRGCWIIPYSLLSARDSSDILEGIKPELMIFDEAHHLKRRTSARTKRVLTFWKANRPRCVFTSGTMTAKSLKDYAHLLTMSLGSGAPVPVEAEVVLEWAATLDSEQNQDPNSGWSKGERKTSAGALRPLINWSNANFPATQLSHDVPGFRRAFQNRLVTTPGVVCAPADQLGVSLIIQNRRAPQMAHEGGARLQELSDRLVTEWVTPGGDELEHAMLVWGWRNQLSSGIYYDQVWPDAGEVAEKRRISVDEAAALVERSVVHHKAKNDYHKVLRHWFTHTPHRIGLDTPMLVGKHLSVHGSEGLGSLGPDLYHAWTHAKELDFEGRLERLSVPVRVCPYKIHEAIAWAKDGRKTGVVWFYHNELGQWAHELFQAAGIECIYCPAGKTHDEFLTGDGAAERCKDKIILASMKAHGTGKNLQFLVDQFFLQLPVSELDMEQNIGRTHRMGQDADEVLVATCISNDFDEMALSAILNDALYVRETMNSPRKVLIATWDPLPTIYTSQVLIRAGANAKLLTARQQLLLNERFQNQN